MHVLSQQSFVQVLVFQGIVTVSDPFSLQHVYGLKYQTGVTRWNAKGYKPGKKILQCGTCQQDLPAISRSTLASVVAELNCHFEEWLP